MNSVYLATNTGKRSVSRRYDLADNESGQLASDTESGAGKVERHSMRLDR